MILFSGWQILFPLLPNSTIQYAHTPQGAGGDRLALSVLLTVVYGQLNLTCTSWMWKFSWKALTITEQGKTRLQSFSPHQKRIPSVSYWVPLRSPALLLDIVNFTENTIGLVFYPRCHSAARVTLGKQAHCPLLSLLLMPDTDTTVAGPTPVLLLKTIRRDLNHRGNHIPGIPSWPKWSKQGQEIRGQRRVEDSGQCGFGLGSGCHAKGRNLWWLDHWTYYQRSYPICITSYRS